MHACGPSHFSRVQQLAILWTVACQATLSMGFSRQEYSSGLPGPLAGGLPDHGSLPCLLHRQVGSLPMPSASVPVPPGTPPQACAFMNNRPEAGS